MPTAVPFSNTAVVDKEGRVMVNELPETATVLLFRALVVCDMKVSFEGNEDNSRTL